MSRLSSVNGAELGREVLNVSQGEDVINSVLLAGEDGPVKPSKPGQDISLTSEAMDNDSPDLSGDSLVQSTDSAIGITPDLTPDKESQDLSTSDKLEELKKDLKDDLSSTNAIDTNSQVPQLILQEETHDQNNFETDAAQNLQQVSVDAEGNKILSEKSEEMDVTGVEGEEEIRENVMEEGTCEKDKLIIENSKVNEISGEKDIEKASYASYASIVKGDVNTGIGNEAVVITSEEKLPCQNKDDTEIAIQNGSGEWENITENGESKMAEGECDQKMADTENSQEDIAVRLNADNIKLESEASRGETELKEEVEGDFVAITSSSVTHEVIGRPDEKGVQPNDTEEMTTHVTEEDPKSEMLEHITNDANSQHTEEIASTSLKEEDLKVETKESIAGKGTESTHTEENPKEGGSKTDSENLKEELTVCVEAGIKEIDSTDDKVEIYEANSEQPEEAISEKATVAIEGTNERNIEAISQILVTKLETDSEEKGYEEDSEDEDEEEEISESEMVVSASMQFPLAKKVEVPPSSGSEDEGGKEVKKEGNDLSAVPEQGVAVQVKRQVQMAAPKEETPSGCESDVEDNTEEDSIEDTQASPSPLLPSPLSRVPTSLQLPETVTRLNTPFGSSVFLVGTAHFSRESQEDVAATIRAVKPDIVVVELCKARTAILQLDEETILQESRSLDFKKVQMILRQHGKVQGVLYLLLLSVSAHITKQLGMAPGGEFRTAFSEARRSAPGCLIQLGDRPIQVTLSRALASLSLWHKIKLTWHILTSKEPISKEEVEKCKQRDFIEEMLAEMTGQFPAISEVFVKERDVYLCRSLQGAAQPVPNPLSPTGMSPRVVVGVVGIGHVPGIVERWGTVTDEDIPPIMRIPPQTLSSKVLKVTFRVSMYGLLGYGIYKCLPGSAKSAVNSTIEASIEAIRTIPKKWSK